MNIFKIQGALFLGLLGALSLLLGVYMAVFAETPLLGADKPFLILTGIDRLMGIYPFALGLYLCFKAKWSYEDNYNFEKKMQS